MEEKSRTQSKHEAQDLQRLGERLAELSREQIKSLDIPERLKEAVLFVQTISRHGAKRRQFQFIGSLMRDIDPGTITRALETLDMARSLSEQKFKEAEAWRERLMNDEDASLEAFIAAYPMADRQRLRQLVRNAKKELEAGSGPKSYRVLFRTIKDALTTGIS